MHLGMSDHFENSINLIWFTNVNVRSQLRSRGGRSGTGSGEEMETCLISLPFKKKKYLVNGLSSCLRKPAFDSELCIDDELLSHVIGASCNYVLVLHWPIGGKESCMINSSHDLAVLLKNIL